ncbi:serine protease filzig-like [Ischnura elegans]|uniref:serine protease filzig-like n=1 Tax=Ischnura elegans TaxID=197161 RepID=UPI001ED86B07|nr:serine protease filzig-like [Ischnura elegans]
MTMVESSVICTSPGAIYSHASLPLLALLSVLLLRPLLVTAAPPTPLHPDQHQAPQSYHQHGDAGEQQRSIARSYEAYSPPASSDDWVPSNFKMRRNDRASKMFGGYRIVPKPCKAAKSDEEGVCMFNHECQRRKGEVLNTCMDGFLFGACCRLPPGVTLPPALPVPTSTRRPSPPRPRPTRPPSSSPTPPPHAPPGLLNPGLHTDTVLVYENGTVLNDTDIIPLDIFYPPSRLPPQPQLDSSPTWSKRPTGVSPPVTDPPDLPNAIGHIISMLDGHPPQLRPDSPTSFPPTRDPPGAIRPQQTRPPPPTVIVLLNPHPDLLEPGTTIRPNPPTYSPTTPQTPSPSNSVGGKPLNDGDNEDVGEELGDLDEESKPSDVEQPEYLPPKPENVPPKPGSGPSAPESGPSASESGPSAPESAPPAEESTQISPDEIDITTAAPTTPKTPSTTTPIEGTTPVFEDPALNDKVSALVSNIVSSLAVDFHVLQDVVLRQNTTGGVKPLSPSLNYLTTTRRPPTKITTKRPFPTKRPQVSPVVADETVPEKPQRPGTRPPRPTKPTAKPTPKPPSGSRPTKPPGSVSKPTRPPRPPTKRPTPRPTRPTTEALVAEAILPSTTETPKPPKKTTTAKPTTTTTIAAPTAAVTLADPVVATSSPSRPTTTERPAGDFRNACGVRPLMKKKGRIVGGKGATFGEWPWQVLVRESTWLGLFTKNKCGGVLITSRYVVTAAHCQPGFLASLVAVFGEFDLTSELESRRAITRNVRRVIVHRRYDAATFENDLALLELDSPVTYQQHIVPICMPRNNEDFTGRVATVTGWGRLKYGGGVPSVLQEVQVPVLENSVCQEMFKTAGHAKSILNSFVCAGYANGQKDSCEGDSGGPLMAERDDGRWVLIGTVSHGIKCAAPYLPGVYMRTTYYKPWLHSITGVE